MTSKLINLAIFAVIAAVYHYILHWIGSEYFKLNSMDNIVFVTILLLIGAFFLAWLFFGQRKGYSAPFS